MNLQNTTFGLFNNAAGSAGQMYNTGLGMLGQGGGWMGDAAGGLSGFADGSNSVANTNLSPYMNPFQQQVTDATMGELNRQELMQGNAMKDEAQRAGAFGGDRMAIQQAENNRNFDMTRASTLANLNSQNFTNAQGQANNDLNRGFQAFSGLGQLGQGMAGMGQNQMQYGQGQMGNLAGQGFQMGRQINQDQMQAGNQQQQQLQDILNNIMGQTNQWQTSGDTGLGRYFGATQNPGGYGTSTTKGSTSSNMGMGGILGSLLQLGGLFPGA